MIAATRRWFRRNRTNLAVGAGLLGAGYLAGQYVVGKLTEARQRIADERIARENLRRRFEQNQEDCTFTVLAILPTATENITEALPVEDTVNELQRQKAERLARSVGPSEIASTEGLSAPPSVADDDQKSLKSFQSESFVHASQIADSSSGNGATGAEGATPPPRSKKTKVQLWNEMKISAIARAFTLIYTLSLLTLLTRIQLNLLGRRNYLASVVSLASPPQQGSRIALENHDDDNFEQAYGNDFETNRKYLSFSWWLLHQGCKDVMEKVISAVKEVFGSINPREDLTLERLSALTIEIRKKVEGTTDEERRSNKWLPYLLPSHDKEDYVLRESGMLPSSPESSPATDPTTPSLRRLLDETSDLIDSPQFTHVLTLLLDSAFSLLIDTKIASLAYKIPQVSASAARVQEVVEPDTAKCKLANCLPVFSRQAHAIGSGTNNEYLAAMESVRDLEAFAAVVYSSNFEFEAPESGSGETSGEVSNVETVEPTEAGTVGIAIDEPAASMEKLAEAAAEATAGAPQEPKAEDTLGEESIIEKDDSLEAAWGKALTKEDGKKSDSES